MNLRSLLGPWSLALVLSACGGGRATDGEGESSAGTQSESAEGADAESSVSASGGVTSAMSGSEVTVTTAVDEGESGGVCDPIPNEFGPPLEVTLTNASTSALYIELADECNQRVLGGLESDAMYASRNPDCWSCETMFETGCLCPPEPGPPCFSSAGLKLAPGASYTETLSTSHWLAHPVDPACVGEQCGEQCHAAAPLPPDAYRISATVSTDASCEFFDCDCITGAQGWCFIEGPGALGPDAAVQSVEFMLPSSDVEFILGTNP